MIKINNVPVMFIHVEDNSLGKKIENFIRELGTFFGRIVFLDTQANQRLLEILRTLVASGFDVTFIDHHDCYIPPPANRGRVKRSGTRANLERDRQVVNFSSAVKELLGSAARISNRQVHPSCCCMVKPGEFQNAIAIITDTGPDGLLAAMKAVGQPGALAQTIDQDASALHMPRARQRRLSELAQLLSEGFAGLPTFSKERPLERSYAVDSLFQDVVLANLGDELAWTRLREQRTIFLQAVKNAIELAQTASLVARGVAHCETGEHIWNKETLLEELRKRFPGLRIVATSRRSGLVASYFRSQVTLYRIDWTGIDLRNFAPAGTFGFAPKEGIVSNKAHLMHCSPEIWTKFVLPALRANLGQV